MTKRNERFVRWKPLDSAVPRRSVVVARLRQRLRRGKDLAAEATALEADAADRAEMLSVATLMESLRAPR